MGVRVVELVILMVVFTSKPGTTYTVLYIANKLYTYSLYILLNPVSICLVPE